MHTDISRTGMIFEAKISLHEVPKSINFQTNDKSSMALQQNYKYFSIKLSIILLCYLHLKVRSASFHSFKVKCGMRWIFGNLQNSC